VRALLLAAVVCGACHSDAPSETCGAPAACAAGDYRTCTAKSGCSLRTSDGKRFACAACGDCQAASAQVTAWCGGGATDGGGPDLGAPAPPDLARADDTQCWNGPANNCRNCCFALHPDGAQTFGQELTACACVSPGACKTQCAATLCNNQVPAGDCTGCLGTALDSGGACEPALMHCYDALPGCGAYLDCAAGCG
jgi:hypothetical protein